MSRWSAADRIRGPGEISLAHHGVLFLDEMAEFSRTCSKCCGSRSRKAACGSRARLRTVVFPARFMLIGAMNPCPCGYHGDASRPCRCSPMQIARYESRLSGPLRDRMDLTVAVAALPARELAARPAGESSASRPRPRRGGARTGSSRAMGRSTRGCRGARCARARSSMATARRMFDVGAHAAGADGARPRPCPARRANDCGSGSDRTRPRPTTSAEALQFRGE